MSAVSTVFSHRVAANLTTNRLTQAVARLRAEGRELIDLTLSNPTRAGVDYPSDLLAPLADSAALRYDPSPFGSMDARRAVESDYARRGAHVPAERIVLTAGTSDAYSMLFKLLTDAGDDVLVPRPSYPLFDHLTRLDLVATRVYDVEYHGAWTIDVGSIDRGMTSTTRAVLLVSPNNPTGSFATRAELDRVAALCAPRDIALIVDEVFVDYELAPGASAAAARPTDRTDVLWFALGGLSKSVGLPQVKLAWIAVGGPDRLVKTAIDRLELICDTYLPVSTPVQHAAPMFLERGRAIRDQIAERVSGNYLWLQSAVTKAPSCSVLRADAGWSAVIQVPSLAPEEEMVVRLLTDDGVLAHPGYFFDFPRESFLVVSLLPPPATFVEGVTRALHRFGA